MRNGQYSVKTDVYSFGVLLLEIISGRKNNSFSKYGDNSFSEYGNLQLLGYVCNYTLI